MIFMLDTDVCSYIMRGHPRELLEVFEARRHDEICMSVVTHAEILYGIKNKHSDKLTEKYKAFSSLVKIIPWTERSAERYAEIRAALKKAGTPVGNMDIMIAASALALGAELVTNNKKHFAHIPGIKIDAFISLIEKSDPRP